jgi:hypothetical protein
MSELAPDADALGPLAPLIGEWEGDQGSDDAYVYARGRDESCRFRELSTFTPAGPAHNGAQSLYRPDHTTTARTTGFRMTVDLSRPDEFSYDQQKFMYQPHRNDLYRHRDRNTLVRR